ncbi:MAG: glycosyltransferase [Kofleriaceae bacterium]|nr:glycosyltransferase [Myxococcales bacterium]MCB9561547.1 glycosyltransferase [Kofleriaceae bacterium]MCB9572264.1 glycosyltransferase [Kofleriaceae bacterium]
MADATPQVSVVVRSYNRYPALCELLTAILAQRDADFEVVVVDQTTKAPDDARARLAALAADPRVRILTFPPLGGPRARNEGVRAARGEIVLLIDDDDLPGDDRWIASHAANYVDPNCVAVNGRAIVEGDRDPPYGNMARAERNVMSLSWLGWQRPYSKVNVKKRVHSVVGGNASIRRSAIARAGLWDECTPVEDEVSFAYRLRARMRPDEYILFDPACTMQRRLDIPGGMGKRYLGTTTVARRHFQFLHRIVGHYFPWKYWLLQPAYVFLLYWITADWVIDDSHGHPGGLRKAWTLVWFALALPLLWTWWLGAEVVRRVRSGPLQHEPRL